MPREKIYGTKPEETEAFDFLNEVTKWTLMRLASVTDRAEIDGIITNYFGFMRTATSYFDFRRLDTTKIQKKLARQLKIYLKEYRTGTMPSATGNVRFGIALKFAFEKLKYENVEDIHY